jgi:hypothetical protein
MFATKNNLKSLISVGVLAVCCAHAAIAAETPAVKAHISYSNQEFDQIVQVTYSPAIDIPTIRQHALDTNLLKELSTWVADASFRTVGEDDQFWLTIGKANQDFTHMFHCKEQANDVAWQLSCNEDATQPDGKKAVLNTTKSIQCTNSKEDGASPSTTQCLFEMKGQAQELVIEHILHIQPRSISYTLFSETVNYVLGMSYLVSGLSADPMTVRKETQTASVYAPMLKEIEKTADIVKAAKSTDPLNYDFSSDVKSATANNFDVPTFIDDLTMAALAPNHS